MFRITLARNFYRANSKKSYSNPLRRWIPFYAAGGVLGASVGYGVLRYVQLHQEVRRHGDNAGNYLCGPTMLDFLSLLPFNALSSSAGVLSSQQWLPTWIHQQFISLIVRYYGVELDEAASNTFLTFQDFYSRSWKPDARPVCEQALLVSPCDGEVLTVLEGVDSERLVQVKNCSYSFRSLFRSSPPALPKNDMKRVMIVFKLSVKDFHHVVAPCSFQCDGTVYVPGTLFPITQIFYHYIPGLLTMNERVVVHGKTSNAPLFLALVGSTLTGNIKLTFDSRLKTNFMSPQEYDISAKYKSPLALQKGVLIGNFLWGSAVVLLTDVPKSSNLRVDCGSHVKAGEALLSPLPSHGSSTGL